MGSFTYFLRLVRSQAKERKERRKKTRSSRKEKKKHGVKEEEEEETGRDDISYTTNFGNFAHITECRVQHRTISL